MENAKASSGLRIEFPFLVLKVRTQDGEIVLQLKGFAPLAEDQGSVPSTHARCLTTIWNASRWWGGGQGLLLVYGDIAHT